jgi:acetyl esterase/lipase
MLLATPGLAASQPAAGQPGAITVPGFSLPPSSLVSPEAVALNASLLAQTPPPANATIDFLRDYYGTRNTDRVRRMRAIYDVKIVQTTLSGVSVQRVTPAAGVAAANRHRVLINVHGGAFSWGSGSGALVEAIPIAATAGIEVVTVDYRLGPEGRFPAASEDVAAVYSALLADHSPKAIGIYGCSAGGFVTAQSIAWLIARKIPLPGAISTACGSVVDIGGDSLYFGAIANGGPVPTLRPTILARPYFIGAKASDPLVLPGTSKAVLAQFPPTLLLTSTRDFVMSSVLRSNELLRQAGVETELRVWDGLGHAFYMDPEPPESKEAYAAISQFFLRHLSASGSAGKGD